VRDCDALCASAKSCDRRKGPEVLMDLVAVIRYAPTVVWNLKCEVGRVVAPFIICSSLFSRSPQDFDSERPRK
jgi:hypothetical protein